MVWEHLVSFLVLKRAFADTSTEWVPDTVLVGATDVVYVDSRAGQPFTADCKVLP